MTEQDKPAAAPTTPLEPVAWYHASPNGNRHMVSLYREHTHDPHEHEDRYAGWTVRPLVFGDGDHAAAWHALLRDFQTIAHDNEYALGDRLQRISTRISGILAGAALDQYPAHLPRIVEQAPAESCPICASINIMRLHVCNHCGTEYGTADDAKANAAPQAEKAPADDNAPIAQHDDAPRGLVTSPDGVVTDLHPATPTEDEKALLKLLDDYAADTTRRHAPHVEKIMLLIETARVIGRDEGRKQQLAESTALWTDYKAEAKHWKANHDNMVARCALLSQREDLPVDRIPAYQTLIELQARVSALDASMQFDAPYCYMDDIYTVVLLEAPPQAGSLYADMFPVYRITPAKDAAIRQLASALRYSWSAMYINGGEALRMSEAALALPVVLALTAKENHENQ